MIVHNISEKVNYENQIKIPAKAAGIVVDQ